MALHSLLELQASPYMSQMTPDDTANLIYLSLLGGVIMLSYLVASRTNIGQSLQQAGIWALIFIGVIAVVGMWSDIEQIIKPRQTVMTDQSIVLPRQADGHYYLTLNINDVPVDFVVDTGASQVVLTQQDAGRIGLDPTALTYLGRANTANGEVRTAAVRLDRVTLGEVTDANVRAVVNGGMMEGSLLGMTYLSRFDSITISNGELILRR